MSENSSLKRKLVVGLGNPQEEYRFTPHNAGFWVIESFLNKVGGELENMKKVHGKAARFFLNNEEIIVLVPQTYMNNSGISVREALSYWKIRTNDLIVVHDESDLHLGRIKIGFNQSSGGHKGVESIIRSLGSSSFTRIKVGVRPPTKLDESSHSHVKSGNFILKKFDQSKVKLISENGLISLSTLLAEGKERAMNIYNKKDFIF